ncbi:MAG: phosphohydrolase [Desulfuromonadales bacterium C00003068]|jgi:uncharacterized protein|nr:MAG: phosphohydrolase [Desulfuromonadales bacterium C00003068]
MIQAIDLIEKYFLPHTKAYRILRTHSEQVANKAILIGQRLNQQNHNDSIDIDFIAEAALLHDIGIFAVHAPGLGCFGQQPYLRHGLIGAQLLNAIGLPRHARVCERHIGVGLTAKEIAIQELPLPQRDYLPLTIEEQIITYADLFFSKNPNKLTQEKPSTKVRQTVVYYGEEKGLIFDQWHSQFGQ